MMTALGMAEILQKFNKWDCFTIHSTDDNNEDEDENDDDDDNEEDTGTCNANNDAVSSAVIQEVCSADQTEIEGDIGAMLKAGLVQENTAEKLNEIRKLLVPKRIESSTIPMFSLVHEKIAASLIKNHFHHL